MWVNAKNEILCDPTLWVALEPKGASVLDEVKAKDTPKLKQRTKDA